MKVVYWCESHKQPYDLCLRDACHAVHLGVPQAIRHRDYYDDREDEAIGREYLAKRAVQRGPCNPIRGKWMPLSRGDRVE